jgi:hypothetical protein
VAVLSLRRIGIVFFLILAGVRIAWAHEVRQGDQCVIAVDETIEGNLFVLCRTLTINGVVDGDVIGAATNGTINGQVNGNVYLLDGQLDVHGELGKDLLFAGAVLRIHPDAHFLDSRADVISADLSTTLFDGVTVPGSVLGVGYQMVIQGRVNHQVSFWGSALSVDGMVNGDITATVGDSQSHDVSQLQAFLTFFPVNLTLVPPGLNITQQAVLNGNLHYSAPTPGNIDGKLAHDPVFTEINTPPTITQIDIGQEDTARGVNLYLSQVVREFITLGLIGVVALLVAPHGLQSPLQSLRSRPLPSLGLGMLTFILSFPILFIVVIVSLLLVFALSLLQLSGLTLVSGVILGMFDIGGASLFYFLAIFVARVIVALAIGRLALRWMGRAPEAERLASWLSLLIGVITLAVLASLPVIGLVINAVAAFLGLGAILTLLQIQFGAARDNIGTPRYTTVSSIAGASRIVTPPGERPTLPPPPIIEEPPRGLGMENLPPGFHWWDED